MKTFVLASTIALTLVSGQAMAACSAGGGWTQMTAVTPPLIGDLAGKTVCVGTGSPWTAQEYHQAGGALIDWKRGLAAPGNVDPTKQVGTWNVVGDQVQYLYNVYTPNVLAGPYDVYTNNNALSDGAALSFCTGTTSAVEATIKTGQVPC